MKIVALQEHKEHCDGYCSGARYFVFQYRHEFYCIIYCGCYYDGLDFKEAVLKGISVKENHLEKFDRYRCGVSRSNDLKNYLKEKNTSLMLGKRMQEVCYVYSNNANRLFAMAAESSYQDYLSTLVLYEDNFLSAMRQLEDLEFIDETEKKIIEDQIFELHRYNRNDYEDLSCIQKMNLTDLLTRHFIKQTT